MIPTIQYVPGRALSQNAPSMQLGQPLSRGEYIRMAASRVAGRGLMLASRPMRLPGPFVPDDR